MYRQLLGMFIKYIKYGIGTNIEIGLLEHLCSQKDLSSAVGCVNAIQFKFLNNNNYLSVQYAQNSIEITIYRLPF